MQIPARPSSCTFLLLHALGAGAISCCVLAPLNARGQTSPKFDDAMRRGGVAMQQGHPEQAEAAFADAVRLGPMVAGAHLDLGLALLREGKLQQAQAELKKAQELDPNDQGAPLFLGIAEFELGHMDEARSALRHEIQLSPENAEANMWLGVVELTAGHPEAAVPPLDRAAELAPTNLDILDYRGRAHQLVSVASYDAMARIDPDSWHVHRALGQSYSEQGRSKEAIAEYKAAIDLNPKNPDLYEVLGDEYRKTAQFDAAMEAYKKELDLSPDNPVASFDLGSIYIDLNDPKTGLPLMQKAGEHFDHASPVFLYLGIGMAKMDRNQEAITYLQRAIELDPKGDLAQRAYYEESRVYRKIGKRAESQAALNEFLKRKAAAQAANKPPDRLSTSSEGLKTTAPPLASPAETSTTPSKP